MELIHGMDVVILEPEFTRVRELAMEGGEATVHFDLGLCSRTHQRADDTVLSVLAPQEVVQDRKERDGVDRHILNGASTKCISFSQELA